MQLRAIVNDNLLEVSYLASKITTMAGEGHTILEILIKPVLSECCEHSTE
jgi:hypothetical protein